GRGDGPRHEGRGWGWESWAHLRLDMRSLPGVEVAGPLGASTTCWGGAIGRPAESPPWPCGALSTRAWGQGGDRSGNSRAAGTRDLPTMGQVPLTLKTPINICLW
ncbi:unnamed protein product, partial [Bubo scandiacus]